MSQNNLDKDLIVEKIKESEAALGVSADSLVN